MGLGDLSQNALQIAKYREFLFGTTTCTTAATSPSTPAEFRSFRRVTPPTATRSTPTPSSMPSLGEQQQELTTSSGDQDSSVRVCVPPALPCSLTALVCGGVDARGGFAPHRFRCGGP